MLFLTNILTSPWINVLGIFLGAAGIGAAWIFYRKSIKARRLTYYVSTEILIDRLQSRFENLKVQYGSATLTTFAVSKVYIWNDGRETIRRDDIPKSNSIRLLAPAAAQLLDAKLLFQTDEANAFLLRLEASSNSVQLEFDYIDFRQGGVIQLLHTSSGKDPSVIGTVMGGGKAAHFTKKNHSLKVIAEDLVLGTPLIALLFAVRELGFSLELLSANSFSANAMMLVATVLTFVISVKLSLMVRRILRTTVMDLFDRAMRGGANPT
jgi:hypothetical protein